MEGNFSENMEGKLAWEPVGGSLVWGRRLEGRNRSVIILGLLCGWVVVLFPQKRPRVQPRPLLVGVEDEEGPHAE